MTSFQQKVENLLRSLPLESPKVEVHKTEHGNIIAVITSGSFDKMGEEERQKMVWDAVVSQMDAQEQAKIEFVFTNSLKDAA